MTKLMPGKAEIAVEFRDKMYIGSFEQSAHFDAHADETGVAITFQAGGGDEHKTVRAHFHYALFAEILRDVSAIIALKPAADTVHRYALCDAVEALYRALADGEQDDVTALTPKEEVLLLHILE